ncbi:MAG: chitobiase/beta-hexosaminidase C-terminal domain-containing protein [Terracidiphilus sp.]
MSARRVRGGGNLTSGITPLIFCISILAGQTIQAQYSTVELTNSTEFSKAAQTGFGQPIATDGTHVAYSTGTSLWSQPIAGGKAKRLFAAGTTLPGSDARAAFIYPQVEVDNGIVVFLATDNAHGSDALFGLYAINANGTGEARRIADSSNASNSTNWYDDMDPYGYSWIYQVSKGAVVFALEGTIYSGNLDGAAPKVLWQAEASGFKGCETEGTYHTLFLDNAAYQPATNGGSYAFGAGSTLEFEGLYHGPLTAADTCANLINTGISQDDFTTPVKILPGQPRAAGPFAFINTGQQIQIDGDYVYFGASVASGVSSKEDYTGYFRIPLNGGKAEAIVTNISHVPGLTNSSGGFDEVTLSGFAARNGKFVFLAQDAVAPYPVASFYMVKGSEFVNLFTSGTSVDTLCAGDLESGSLAGLNQIGLSTEGKLVFSAEELPPTSPNRVGPCSYAQSSYRFQPIGYFVLDTNHPLIKSEIEISLSPAGNAVYGEQASMKVTVLPAEGQKNPKDLAPTGTVSVFYSNPEYFGIQASGTGKLDSDGKATVKMPPLQIGTYIYTVAYSGDSNFSSGASGKLAVATHVTPPTFSVKPGTYSSAQSVNLSDTTPGSTIYYTTNGATPTTKSSVFETTISVKSTETIKAIAVASGDVNSAVVTATYTIE